MGEVFAEELEAREGEREGVDSVLEVRVAVAEDDVQVLHVLEDEEVGEEGARAGEEARYGIAGEYAEVGERRRVAVRVDFAVEVDGLLLGPSALHVGIAGNTYLESSHRVFRCTSR